MSIIKSLRGFADGSIDESALAGAVNQESGEDWTLNEKFMQECMSACLPVMTAMAIDEDISGDPFDLSDDDDETGEYLVEAYVTLQNYLLGQGLLDEAAIAVPRNGNPAKLKKSIMMLDKKARFNWFVSMISMRLAKAKNDSLFKKYSMVCKARRNYKENLLKKYKSQALPVAKRLYKDFLKKAKTQSTTKEARAKRDSAPKKKKK